MNDRLAELTGGSSAPSNPFAPAAPAADPSNVDVELGGGGGGGDGGGSAGGDGFMQGFFDQANEVKADIDAIKDACKEMAALSESAVMATGREEVAAKERLNAIITNTNKRVAHAKGQLQAMREETARLKTGGRNVKPAEIRVRENLQTTLTKKFVDLAKDYQGEQNRWKAQVRGKAERAVRAVKPEATEEELDAVFEQNDGVKRVLEAAVLQQSGDPVQVANGERMAGNFIGQL
jgi:t-SNARE complex subunit (syntaxin)